MIKFSLTDDDVYWDVFTFWI